MLRLPHATHLRSFFFFFNDTATTEIYTLSLHDALPISNRGRRCPGCRSREAAAENRRGPDPPSLPTQGPDENLSGDRKSTRLNPSHLVISYAVFCLKKKKSLSINTQWSTTRRLIAT